MSLVNTDIYNITESINDLTKRYIDSEDEETLALSIYGYITSLESKKIQKILQHILRESGTTYTIFLVQIILNQVHTEVLEFKHLKDVTSSKLGMMHLMNLRIS